jgi:hypothetical protein
VTGFWPGLRWALKIRAALVLAAGVRQSLRDRRVPDRFVLRWHWWSPWEMMLPAWSSVTGARAGFAAALLLLLPDPRQRHGRDS